MLKFAADKVLNCVVKAGLSAASVSRFCKKLKICKYRMCAKIVLISLANKILKGLVKFGAPPAPFSRFCRKNGNLEICEFANS